MKIILTSEIFPPRAGGAGWSTRALGLGLRDAGHDVQVITTSPGLETETGLPVQRLHVSGRRRLSVPRVIDRALRRHEDGVIHAQHSLAALGSLSHGRASRTVVTVRDHWPICFWSTQISRGRRCPGCGVVPMTRCVKDHVAAPAPLSWAVIPYMYGDLALKHRALQRAAATLAVSEAVARELRGAGIPRVQVLPNIVDAREIQRIADHDPPVDLPERFFLYIGKLEENKGTRLLVPAVAKAKTGLPLVVLGEGTLAHVVKFDATKHDVPLVMRGWAHRDDCLAAMARATAVVFPSLWEEPLSRVLLEGLALGTPIAAMSTGGTPEILEHETSGLVVDDAGGLGEAVARLAGDAALRERLSEGARERARAFSPEVLIPRYEAVYRALS